MAKAKKTKKEKVEEVLQLPEQSIIKLPESKKLEECEWCFQFDSDEPQIFAWTDDQMNKDEDPKVIFTITNTENSYISFTNSETGKTFKLFAREMTEQGKAQRDKQRLTLKDLQNGSENKETQS
jgi:hypothetical protein